jgi:capsular polysaccharide transport system permease protein
MSPDAGQIRPCAGRSPRRRPAQRRAPARHRGSENERLSTLNVQYSNLLLDETLASTNYLSAAAALEAAKIDAARKLKSLAIVEDATTPDSSTYPRYLYDMVTLIVVCLLVYTVVR